MKKIKLYNVIFPVWFLFVFPPVLLLVLPGNFIIDSMIFFLAAKFLTIKNIKSIYKKTILRVWGFGFLADIVGAVFLFLSFTIPGTWWNDNIIAALAWNPATNIYALLYCLAAITLSGFLIYYLNYNFTFKKIDMDVLKKKRLCFYIALLTAPYLFLLPTELFY